MGTEALKMRTPIVAMLIAVEVMIVGMALYAVGHGGGFAPGMHRAEFAGHSFAPLAVGPAPHIVIDDAQSRVTVAASSDQLVHVRDLSEMHGAFFSNANYPQLHVTRTLDGVRIERPSVQRLAFGIFGFSREAIEVMVPSGSRLEINRCSGANVSGIGGGVLVRSQDGHIEIADLQGSVDVSSDDGYIEARNVRADRLSMQTSDGHLALRDVAAASLSATTRDGRIETIDLDLLGHEPQAAFHTDDGSVRIALAPNPNLTLNASTSDGRIVVDGVSSRNDDGAQRTVRLGSGEGKLTVGTGDGSIHIDTNGAQVQ